MKRRAFLTAAGSGAVMTALPMTDFGNTKRLRSNNQLLSKMEVSLPHNLEVEKKLLGSILNNNRAYDCVSDFLRPEHFFFMPHVHIFEAITKFIWRGLIADPETLKSAFTKNNTLGEISGPEYLADLAEMDSSFIDAGEYGQIVFDLELRRELIQLGRYIMNCAGRAKMDRSVISLIETADQELYNLFSACEVSNFQNFETALINSARGRPETYAEFLTELGQLLGDLNQSGRLFLAENPTLGRMEFAQQLALCVNTNNLKLDSENGSMVGFFSLGMSAEHLANPFFCRDPLLSFDNNFSEQLSKTALLLSYLNKNGLHAIDLFIDDTRDISISKLRLRARRLKRQHNVGLIVIDPLQLVSMPNGTTEPHQTKFKIIQNLKTLAAELDTPILAIDRSL